MGSLLVVGALLLLLLLHELGHFAVARACRVRVAELSLGLGPKLGSFEVGGTPTTVRLLPVAASVRYERDESSEVDAYGQAPPWKRSLIDLGGPFASYLTASVLIFALAVTGSLTPTPSQKPAPQGFGTALELAVLLPVELTRDQFRALERIVFRGETERVQGPVAVGRGLVAEVERGTPALVSALVLLSVAIGFFNLLPIPGLDGGKLLENLLEVARGRRIRAATAAKVQAVSLCALLILVAALCAVEVGFQLFAWAGAVGVPLLLGAGVGILLPGTGRISWRIAWRLSAGAGLLLALSVSPKLGAGAVLLFVVAPLGYRLSARWMLRSRRSGSAVEEADWLLRL